MTTLVWDGKAMYSDSVLVDEFGMRCGTVPKMFAGRYGELGVVVIGVCGDYASGCEAAKWVLGLRDEPPTFSEGADFELLIGTASGLAFTMDADMGLAPAPVPTVAGTGSAYALAALTLGQSAQRAVELAIELDSHSGGKVIRMKPKE